MHQVFSSILPEAFQGAKFQICLQPLAAYHTWIADQGYHRIHPHFAIGLHHPYSFQCLQQGHPQHPERCRTKSIISNRRLGD